MGDKDDSNTNDSAARNSQDSLSTTKRHWITPGYTQGQSPTKIRERLHIISRQSHDVRFVKEAILKAANNHDNYYLQSNRSILHNLPKYDDCTPYGISSEASYKLLEQEVDKLTSFAQTESPPIFNSHDCLKGTGRTDFEALSGLADQIVCNFSTICHDNARHGVQFGGKVISSNAWEELMSTRVHLKARYAENDLHVTGQQPVLLPDPETNAKAYHLLLDYLLATIAWWVVRCADSNYWKAQTIAVLAQWAVKLKIISNDPVRYAEESLSETDAAIQALRVKAEYDEGLIKIGGKKKEVEHDVNFCNIYCEEKTWIRDRLGMILDYLLQSLIIDERAGVHANMFQVCALLYRKDTDFESTSKIWNAHRHGHISTSSTLRNITNSYSLVKLFQSNIEAVEKAPPTSPSDDYVLVEGGINEENPISLSRRVSTMDHAISLMVPLTLMTPNMSRQIGLLMNVAKAFMDDEQVLRQFGPPPRKFAFECTLSTKPWLEKQRGSRKDPSFDPDVVPLAESPLRQGIKGFTRFPTGRAATAVADIRLEYDTKVEEMLGWRIHTDKVTVLCRYYVRTVQILAIMLVMGGLSVPFSVGKRINGVDPFQIATYTWLLAGFFLVVAKSLYVDNWPWNDFLHGRVECNSISDLSEVSGIDPQLILLFLLRNEWNHLLDTEGPHNGMFRRKIQQTGPEDNAKAQKETATSSKRGFSIDHSLHVYTMLASGIVPLKVRDHMGEHLICIDGRKGGWDEARAQRVGNWMTCRNFNSEDLENLDNEESNGRPLREVHRLERVKFKWTKVLGVYVADSRFG